MIEPIIAGVAGIAGLLGWSHKTLQGRLLEIEKMINDKADHANVRTIIEDKMAPHFVESRAIYKEVDHLKEHYDVLESKIDRILFLLSSKENTK